MSTYMCIIYKKYIRIKSFSSILFNRENNNKTKFIISLTTTNMCSFGWCTQMGLFLCCGTHRKRFASILLFSIHHRRRRPRHSHMPFVFIHFQGKPRRANESTACAQRIGNKNKTNRICIVWWVCSSKLVYTYSGECVFLFCAAALRRNNRNRKEK